MRGRQAFPLAGLSNGRGKGGGSLAGGRAEVQGRWTAAGPHGSSPAMWIMLAGPYSTGEADAETRAARLKALNAVALEVFRRGHVPVIGVNMALPIIAAAGNTQAAHDEVMMPLSLALAERCDACLRLGGPSAGADAEVARFRAAGKPVFLALEEVPPA